MNHTLFAVLALALALILALTSTRSRLSAQQQEAAEEATVFATDAGLELLDRIRALPFDAATAPLGPSEPLAERSALTPEPFASSGTFAAATDVDDVHHMQPHTLSVGGLDMQATASVRYVDEDALTTPSSSPSYAKEVTVLVWGEMLRDTLSFTQVISYP